jgi:hypothetical protein
LAQWLSPLYQSTRCQAQHPSYRSQDERSRFEIIAVSVHAEALEAFLTSSSNLPERKYGSFYSGRKH